MELPKTSTWKKVLLIGCASLFAFALVCGVILALNWDRVSNFVSNATTTLSDLVAVRDALRQQFQVPELSVNVKGTSGVAGPILSVDVVNAPFFVDLDLAGPDGRQKALEIATAAERALPSERTYENYEVIFEKRVQVGMSLFSNQVYRFQTGELIGNTFSYGSGTAEDENVEGPVSEDARKFEHALEVSNMAVEHLKSGDCHTIYAMLGAAMLGQFDEPKFVDACVTLPKKQFGPIQSYKPGQWNFVRQKSGDHWILSSKKIVDHEKGVIDYRFVFLDDGEYRTLVGLSWHPRPGGTGSAPK